jgi:GTP-binding protein
LSRFPAARFLLSVAAATQFPPDQGAEVAFAGRSNAGKSSAINAITQRNALARTSKTPGQTRLLNYFELSPGKRIVDLPGYGYAAVPPAERARWIPLIDRLRERECLAGLFLIVDSRRGLKDEDLGVIEWADPSARRIHVVLTKADKLSRNEARQTLKQAVETLGETGSAQLFSAHTGEGVEQAQKTLAGWLAGTAT